MPDLVTHFTVAYCFTRPARWARFRVIFYLGTILPDLITRPLYILFPSTAYYVYSLHSPIMIVIVSLLISQIFERNIRRHVLLFLLLGTALHFVLDLLQKQVLDAYYWLFPFSWKTCNLGLFWPEDALTLLPVWVCLIIIVESTIQFRNRSSSWTSLK